MSKTDLVVKLSTKDAFTAVIIALESDFDPCEVIEVKELVKRLTEMQRKSEK